MKKAKIFLAALTVLAISGGALAFKAKVFRTFAKCNLENHLCEMEPVDFMRKTTANGGNIIAYDLFGNPCISTNGNWTCQARVTFDE